MPISASSSKTQPILHVPKRDVTFAAIPKVQFGDSQPVFLSNLASTQPDDQFNKSVLPQTAAPVSSARSTQPILAPGLGNLPLSPPQRLAGVTPEQASTEAFYHAIKRSEIAQRTFELGVKAYEENRYTDAMNFFSQAITMDPQDFEALNKRGVVRFRTKDYVGAMGDYTRAIISHPDFEKAYINRGNLWNYVNNQQLTLEDYGQAIRVNPFSIPAYESRSELYADMNLPGLANTDRTRAYVLQRQKPPESFAPGPRYQPRRFALVLANDNYQGTPFDLYGSSYKDGAAMAAQLRSQGFDVIEGYDLDSQGLNGKVQELVKKLKANPGSVSFTYYSGHGGSIDNNNFLIPVDYSGLPGQEFESQAVSVESLLAQLAGAETGLNMVVFDACRNLLLNDQDPCSTQLSVNNGRSAASQPLQPGTIMMKQPVVKKWETELNGPSNAWIEYASRPRRGSFGDGVPDSEKQVDGYPLSEFNYRKKYYFDTLTGGMPEAKGFYTRHLIENMRDPSLNLKTLSMKTSLDLEQDARNLSLKGCAQHARTQTDITLTRKFAEAFYFTRPWQAIPYPEELRQTHPLPSAEISSPLV